MRRADEIAFYAAPRAISPASHMGAHPGIVAFDAASDALGIPSKRAWALAEKWSTKGWWDYGTSPRGGWFTPDAPERLLP